MVVASNCASQPIYEIDTSILAGDGMANEFARLMLYRLLDFMHFEWPTCGPQQHVDDIAQVATGSSAAIASAMVNSGCYMVEQLAKCGLEMSPKSVFVPSSSPAVKQIVK